MSQSPPVTHVLDTKVLTPHVGVAVQRLIVIVGKAHETAEDAGVAVAIVIGAAECALKPAVAAGDFLVTSCRSQV